MGKRSSVIRQLAVVALVLLTTTVFAARAGGKRAGKGTQAESAAKSANGWISLFDGKTLDGWKANEVPESWVVKDGTIVTQGGQRSHLFYEGPVQDHNFKNFEFKCDVMTTTGANSGLFIHTKFQPTGWPSNGYEAQVNSTHGDPIRTGSLYGVKDIREPEGSSLSKDGKWFNYDITVQGKHIVFKIDGKTVMDYTEPEAVTPPKGRAGRMLSSGTFALQAHPPAKPGQAGTVCFKNIMVKPLP